MQNIWIAIISGLTGAGFFGMIQFLITRHDKKKEQDSVERKALCYIMLYITEERAKELIDKGKVTLEEVQSLRRWHDLYHDGLGGNGDADYLMRRVDSLPIVKSSKT